MSELSWEDYQTPITLEVFKLPKGGWSWRKVMDQNSPARPLDNGDQPIGAHPRQTGNTANAHPEKAPLQDVLGKVTPLDPNLRPISNPYPASQQNEPGNTQKDENPNGRITQLRDESRPFSPFDYVKPTPEMQPHFDAVSADCTALYRTILEHVPSCPDRTLALRELQLTRMWANSAIVFEGKNYLQGPEMRKA